MSFYDLIKRDEIYLANYLERWIIFKVGTGASNQLF